MSLESLGRLVTLGDLQVTQALASDTKLASRLLTTLYNIVVVASVKPTNLQITGFDKYIKTVWKLIDNIDNIDYCQQVLARNPELARLIAKSWL